MPVIPAKVGIYLLNFKDPRLREDDENVVFRGAHCSCGRAVRVAHHQRESVDFDQVVLELKQYIVIRVNAWKSFLIRQDRSTQKIITA